MLFKRVIKKVRRAILCCKQHRRKPSLDIGSPTNVRHIPITDSHPGLTESERTYIREKASSDAIHLLGLHTSPPSPTGSNSPLGSHSPSIMSMSRENSEPLLNAASKDLPEALPTPPRRAHNESSPPAVRMKGMSTWDFVEEGTKERGTNSPARKLSFSTSSSSASNPNHQPTVFDKIHLGDKLSRSDSGNDKTKTSSPPPPRTAKDLNESLMTLNFEFDWEDGHAPARNTVETPRTLSLSEGFEMQDTVGGHAEPSLARNKVVQSAVKETAVGDSSEDSDSEVGSGERTGLVKV